MCSNLCSDWFPWLFSITTSHSGTDLLRYTNCYLIQPKYTNAGIDLLVQVKASASREEDPGFESHLRQDFSGSSHTSDLKIGTPVTTLPDAWRYRVSAGTG